MKSLLTLISLSLSFIIFAQDSVSLKKDDKAPFDGVLLSSSKAREVYNDSLRLEGTILLNESLQKTIDLQKQNLSLTEDKNNILLKRNDDLAIKLNNQMSVNTWEKSAYFGLGAILTGVAFYGAYRIVR